MVSGCCRREQLPRRQKPVLITSAAAPVAAVVCARATMPLLLPMSVPCPCLIHHMPSHARHPSQRHGAEEDRG